MTKEAGGEDCLWLGMIGGDFISQGRRFRDIKAICDRTEMIMLDDQGRDDGIGFQENAEMGKRLHGLLGWEKMIPESMATYQRSPVFRKSAASKPESRMWMYAGFAGGIQPWWHHVGAYQWDRRQFATEIPVYEWHARNERFLFHRLPLASVGIVYSQENADFYGRDAAAEKVGRPYYGMIQALVRARNLLHAGSCGPHRTRARRLVVADSAEPGRHDRLPARGGEAIRRGGRGECS